MEQSSIDLSRVCRTCKNGSSDMRPLYTRDSESGKENPRIDEMLMACASIQVESTDGLPSSICRTCIYQLKNAYEFKILCEKTDVFFRDYYASIKDETVKEESKEITITFDDIDELNVKDNEEEVNDEALECNKSKRDYIELLENNVMLLTCRTCGKAFTTLDGLKCHKRIHSGALFKCKQCDKEYTRLNHLQRHEMSAHGRKKVHVCKICNKTLTRLEHLKRHLIIHLKDKPYNCQLCSRGFNRSEHLANHATKCNGEKVFSCEICNKGFNREDSLEVHKKIHEHQDFVLPTLENLDNIDDHYIQIDFDDKITYDNSDIDSDDSPDNNENCTDVPCEVLMTSENDKEFDLTSNEIYAEEDPPEMLAEKAKIEELLKENDGFDDCIDNESDSAQSEYTPTRVKKRKRGRPRKQKGTKPRGRPPLVKIKAEVQEDDEGEHTCPQCNAVYLRLRDLEKHALEHDGLKLHGCKKCQKKFTRNTHLKRHMLTHLEEKPFTCDLCEKCFTRRDHLQQHMKMHDRSIEYSCEICLSVFHRADHLTKHNALKHNIGERVMGDKKYQCTVCLKGFTTEKYRDVHMRNHTGDKTFVCKVCSKRFVSKSHLTEHMKFHTDTSKKYLCSECGQRFIRNDYLVIHMRRHRGEKPFKCRFCGKGFPRTTDLTVHERYHTGEKTHLCVICGRGFGRAYNLTVHMRTHTGEKPYQCSYCDAAFAQGNDLKAHVRRHTGERFHCDLCSQTFLMGYMLTQHKRTAHGLNVVSNIRRLQPTNVLNPDEPPPITVPLPPPMVILTGE